MLQLPRLYPIIDPASFGDTAEMFAAAEEFATAGCTLPNTATSLATRD
jgi:hypothetical protein